MSNEAWLERLPEAVLDWLDGRKPDDVECIVPDIAGMSRGKTMPAKKFSRGDKLYLPASIFYQTITGEYVEVKEMPNQWIEADQVLVPDYSAATSVPWSNDVTLQVIHDVQNRDGSPLSISPRNVLRHIVACYAEQGWQPVVSPELEFYLTKPNTDPDYPIEPPVGRSGRAGVARQAYSMSAVEEYNHVIDDIYDFAEAQGLEIDTIIQEGGAGQIEINLQHGDPVNLADQVFFYKRLIREAALRNGCFATFMAKPMEGQPGSAMHIHQSVIDSRTGKNIFNNDDDLASPAFMHYIGGLQQHLPSVMCILAPYVNSYRRFVPDEAAPINLEWGEDNRTAGLRVPISSPESRRIENRVVGMDCNPYLAFASTLACGYLGLINQLHPREPITSEAYTLPHALPAWLPEALDLFCENSAIWQLLGNNFCHTYAAIKRQEAEAYQQVISPWEREHLLLNV